MTVKHAKLFKHGGSQAVRLPKEYRMPGTEVTIRPMGRGVYIEPVSFDVDEWLSQLRLLQDPSFMENGREQPAMPPDKPLFD